MKVIETTETRLVIEDRPWFLWCLLPLLGLPAIFAAVTGQVAGVPSSLLVGSLGLGALWVLHHFAPFQRFTFDRETGLFIHDLRRVTGSRQWSLPLTDIERAAPQSHYSDGARLERVYLITTSGRYPLESGYSSRSTRPAIEAINAWIGPDR